ncbi:pimeloyl-ACP methyl ester carboxylesterase [Sagittula marina]|uniref:Pimeloyl-ACP methyl ester carboxylesterase n=1 Tax=Sagittula marina TaxID=943940 RepID=A0A7W6GV56_9RHOB|nr:alpha/beta hydrolase [Sagittula marina]MBB3986974.1 pimeloyl-ACP methyl ester carboxylesterase [Sagittula marina]
MATFKTSDGVDLYYTDEGEGVPVLCLAGLTRDGRDFDFVAPHLLDMGVRLIRMDYRGRGRSGWAPWETYQIPVEGRDAVELLDHLGLEKAAVLGTSRGGLIAMGLAFGAKDRLMGVALNDVGPVIADAGLDVIKGYLGKVPAMKTLDEVAARRKQVMTGFDLPDARWRAEAERLFVETEDGLSLTYDPKLRDAVLGGGAQPVPDLWPFYDALVDLPLCVIRGANSDLLSPETYAEMLRRRPDAVTTEVPGRGHIPFLDEPESLAALRRWIEMV